LRATGYYEAHLASSFLENHKRKVSPAMD